MKCSWCSTPIADGQTNCPSCGTAAPKPATVKAKKTTKKAPAAKAAEAAKTTETQETQPTQPALTTRTFWVPGQPIQQGSMKAVGKAGRGLLVDVKASQLAKWRPAVAKAAQAAQVGYAPKETPIYIDVIFCLPKPKTATRDMPCALVDLDKLCRAIGDALSDVTYTDDRQNVNWTAMKVYVASEEDQGALIRIGPWTPQSASRPPLLRPKDIEETIKHGKLPKSVLHGLT